MSPGLVIPTLLAVSLGWGCETSPRSVLGDSDEASVAGRGGAKPLVHSGVKPGLFEGRGELVCLAQEMKRLHEAEVPPIHEHIPGFLTTAEAKDPDGGAAHYYTLLRTAQSEALFVDKRFEKRTLVLTGRVFPGTDLLEISSFRWLRDGELYEVYYWCEICSIEGVDPGSCACCQRDVELREKRIENE